ncbi:predicted protein [Plenodomus lingam JN3]|uniref:Predicted protein n=1 Tax=Leptosphaeria maculans (strain JN3 / isolate v23.1.3 / race Av1-4-5-6-7-8) TaxID=985895 RepID=E4ZTH8_LEPMJ|nr:predicted protein [Plenodomus lingam JN3]CBX94834.1 predicted protein [Plenodomus lingam JN3]
MYVVDLRPPVTPQKQVQARALPTEVVPFGSLCCGQDKTSLSQPSSDRLRV